MMCIGGCVACEVRHLTLYGKLPDVDGAVWERIRRGTQSFRAKQTILQMGDDPNAYLTIRRGWAFGYLVTPLGARQILWFGLPGEALTPLLDCPVSYSVEALTDCDICFLDRDGILDSLTRNKDTVHIALNHCFVRKQSDWARIAAMGSLAALEKVAFLLRQLQTGLALRGQDVTRKFDFPLRNTHVADTLGLSPVHVSRVFTELKDRGVVERNDRSIQLLDQEKLDRLGRVSADRVYDTLVT